jgi:NAD(P)-dependent dehydrogenase (short-subunit alcohol dehydrogenase family)
MDHFAGKIAVITGAASGIGRAVALRAAAEGMKIVLADIEERPLYETARTLSGAGTDVIAVVTDVSDASSVEALRDRALDRFGGVHLVHNNAGVAAGGPLWTVSESDWRWILGVNLWGVIHGIRAFVPLLSSQGEGHVVNTASAAGLVSPPFMGPYNAAKHAVVTISETLYRDLRLTGSNVGVSVLCPGLVRTNIADSERNRPPWAHAAAGSQRSPSALQLQLQTAVRRQLAAGIDPASVAETVLDAVRTNRFYVLTHPEWKIAVETRMHDILAGRAPTSLEWAP